MSRRVPTNILTGFLGVGKTTSIINLLKNRPEGEKWAVLVNEFGEVGIDGAMLSEQGAMIKEVPGGCMCCSAGVPMSVAITALLRQSPDRLLIEPTGLGHPKEVVAILTSDQYCDYVDLKATLTLVDPRNLSDTRYTQNQNFNDQLDCGDVIVATKTDLCSEQDLQVFEQWLAAQQPAKVASAHVQNGAIDESLLMLERSGNKASEPEAHHHHHATLEPEFILPPDKAYIRKENTGQGYFSCGWLFGAEYQFDFDELFSMLSDLTAERVKAVVNTTKGCYAFNVSNGIVSVTQMTLDGFESRLEVIDSQLIPRHQLEGILLNLAGINR